MRESLCSLLRCPACEASEWSLTSTATNPRETLAGDLRCRGCGRTFPLRNGTVEFVQEADLTEPRRLDRDRSAESDQIILQQKRRGDFVGDLRRREDGYRRETFERTDFFFRNLEYAHPGGRYVLDLGCGEPFLASRFARIGFNVIALDFTFPRLDLAHEYFERDGTYFERLLALMSRLPLRDRSMDVVFSHASLHHATPNRAEEFRWFDPRNMLDTLREVRRVLKPGGLFLVSGEGVYAEDVSDEDRRLEREAQESGCYEAFYKISEYERAFRQAGIFPNIWAQWTENRLQIATFVGGRYRPIVAPDNAVNTSSDLLLGAPVLKRELDACLGGWARVHPWPGGARVARPGAGLDLGDETTFVRGWYNPENDTEGPFRWMGREPGVLAFELDPVGDRWSVELQMRAIWLLGEFETAVMIERQGRVVAKEVISKAVGPEACDQEVRVGADLEAGPAAIRCIRDGRMRVRVYFNSDCLTTLDVPCGGEPQTFRMDLPAKRVRAFNQLTLEPSYALRPCDCVDSADDRWLSCQVRKVRIVGAPAASRLSMLIRWVRSSFFGLRSGG